MNTLLAKLIHASNGYFHETSGMVIAFFDDPDKARRCANEIKVTLGKTVEVCGNRLAIT